MVLLRVKSYRSSVVEFITTNYHHLTSQNGAPEAFESMLVTVRCQTDCAGEYMYLI